MEYKREVFIKLIEKTFPDVKIKKWDDDFLIIMKDDHSFRCGIYEGTNWKYIKKGIDKMYEGSPEDEECDICSEKVVIGSSCISCSQIICYNCDIKILINGKGIHTCPFCRFTYGKLTEKTELLMGIRKQLEDLKSSL